MTTNGSVKVSGGDENFFFPMAFFALHLERCLLTMSHENIVSGDYMQMF
jgi:hypothetical protein